MNSIMRIFLASGLLLVPNSKLCAAKTELLPVRRELASDGNPNYDPKKPFVCEHCPHRARTRDLIRRHNRSMHTGERPFACTLCPWTCNVSWRLKEHELQHTGEKPYACNECQSSFARRGPFVRHMHAHWGVKPYKCAHCSFKSVQQEHVATHQKRLHRNKPRNIIYTPPAERVPTLAETKQKPPAVLPGKPPVKQEIDNDDDNSGYDPFNP